MLRLLVLLVFTLSVNILAVNAGITQKKGNKNEFRTQLFEAFPPVEETAKKLKTNGYNQFENPTGIWFEAGDEVTVTVGNTKGEKVSLRVHNFGEGGEDNLYALKSGKNKLTMKAPGLGYFSFYTSKWASLKPVKVTIEGGKINGYFDKKKHTAEDWKKLLEQPACNVLDIKGDYVNLVYGVEALRKYCPDNGGDLIAVYDEIIDIQHTILGFNKYNKRPKNHMFGRVIWKGFMHADGIGAAFHNNTLECLADPVCVRKNSWGVAHEFGHVNQVRPIMKWVGTTEVTNNIFSVWTQYLFNPSRPKLEIEKIGSYDGNVVGGRFNAYMESAFINKQEWLTQAGPDRWKRFNEKDWGGDHFVKLCPLWQLQLFFAVAGEGNSWYQPDFYADIYNLAIEDNETKGDAESQLAFIKRACDVTKTDLTDFFCRSGMLVEIDKFVDDYTCAQMTITQKQVDNVIAYAKQYKKPATPVMHYITANSVDAYRNKKAIEGTFGQGVNVKENQLIIDHATWKNVTVFETYKGKELIKIAMVGSGSETNSSTLVQYPAGATRVEAVAWDGSRKLVYGEL